MTVDAYPGLPGEPLLSLAAPRARDKGLVAWNPTPMQARLWESILPVLARYRAHLPIGPRTVMYGILAAWSRILDTKGRYYTKDTLRGPVDTTLTMARRAGFVLPAITLPDGTDLPAISLWDAIDDQRTTWDGPLTTASLEGMVNRMQIDRQADQPYRIEVWIETKGNVSRLGNVCKPFGVSVYSGSGSVPVRAIYDAAWRVLDADVTTLILLLSDFDPNGIKNIAQPFVLDLRAMVRDLGRQHRLDDDPERLIVRHLGVTVTQARALPEVVREALTDPPADWPLPYKLELEAMPPDQLDTLVTDALAMVRDQAAYDAAMALEPDQRIDALEELARTLRNGSTT